MQERTAQILRYIIEDYIESSVPVGSGVLVRRYHIPISPATVRIEMVHLTDEGYLHQPHTSAGRVPTERAFRFFVDEVLRAQYNAEVRSMRARKLARALSLQLLAQMAQTAEEEDIALRITDDSIYMPDPMRARYEAHLSLIRDLQDLIE